MEGLGRLAPVEAALTPRAQDLGKIRDDAQILAHDPSIIPDLANILGRDLAG
jgi:hypothetical protein